MHILAFNSSPRDNQTSKTELVLQKFLEGARRAGAETETLYLRNYQIKHCLGCFSCWTKTPGRCVQKDDMAEALFERYLQADLAVLATPLYHYNMNARMKMFIERTLPMVVPGGSPDQRGVHYRYERVPKVAVLSVCGFPAMDTFRCLSLNMQMILGDSLVAEIYRHSFGGLDRPAAGGQGAGGARRGGPGRGGVGAGGPGAARDPGRRHPGPGSPGADRAIGPGTLGAGNGAGLGE